MGLLPSFVIGGLFALAALAAGCSGGADRVADPAPPACAGCAEAIPVNGWCEPCGRGYLAGCAIPSRTFHETLDAHGHELGPGGILCLGCAEAIEVDGFCPRCRYGFVGGKLYFGELSYCLHKGRMRPLGEVTCPGCRALHGAPPAALPGSRPESGPESGPESELGAAGTCAECGAGWVGNVEFRDPALHARAAAQYRRLGIALERLRACETCAIAGFLGRSCPKCGTGGIPDPPGAGAAGVPAAAPRR